MSDESCRPAVSGGVMGGGGVTSDVQRFDPRTRTWSELAPMSTPRYGSAACVLDGKLYITGKHNPHVRDGERNALHSSCMLTLARVGAIHLRVTVRVPKGMQPPSHFAPNGARASIIKRACC